MSDKVIKEPVAVNEVQAVLDKLVGLPVLEIKYIWGSYLKIEIGEPRYWISNYKGVEQEIRRGEFCISFEENWMFGLDNSVMLEAAIEDRDYIQKQVEGYNLGTVKKVDLNLDKETLEFDFSSGMSLWLCNVSFKDGTNSWFDLRVDETEAIYSFEKDRFVKVGKSKKAD